MILNLDRLHGDSEGIVADDSFLFEDALGQQRRLHCHSDLSIRRVGETFRVSADLTGYFTTSCHNCLEAVEQQVQSRLDLVIKRVMTPVADNLESRDDDLILVPKGESRLSLDQYIYENLVVNIPMRIACRADCKGLCSGCGTNLNTGNCTCAAPGDSRWEALRELRDSMPE